jgi:predicted ArsR family transcriptional regulator
MKSTRQLLLELLENKESATAAELSRALMVSPADVRHHLLSLRREGLLEIVEGEKRRTGPVEGGKKRSRGRPALRYRLSNLARPDRFDRLTAALLDELGSGASPASKETLLVRVACRLAGVEQRSGSHATRLVHAVKRLNELYYEASWEARPGDPQLKLGRCPYATLLPTHPELCQMDAELLEILTGSSAVQTARQVPDSRGVRYCLFTMSSKKK